MEMLPKSLMNIYTDKGMIHRRQYSLKSHYINLLLACLFKTSYTLKIIAEHLLLK